MDLSTIFLNRIADEVIKMVIEGDSNKIGGIQAMEHLTELLASQNMETKVYQFANSLRRVLEKSTDKSTLKAAAKTSGALLRSGGGAVELVERNIIGASLQWLKSDPTRHLAAVLIQKELADNNPTVFYINPTITAFFDNIWHAIHDSKPEVRHAAACAFSASLCLLASRETKQRLLVHELIWRKVNQALINDTEERYLHGALLTIHELVVYAKQYARDFMQPKFNQVPVNHVLNGSYFF